MHTATINPSDTQWMVSMLRLRAEEQQMQEYEAGLYVPGLLRLMRGGGQNGNVAPSFSSEDQKSGEEKQQLATPPPPPQQQQQQRQQQRVSTPVRSGLEIDGGEAPLSPVETDAYAKGYSEGYVRGVAYNNVSSAPEALFEDNFLPVSPARLHQFHAPSASPPSYSVPLHRRSDLPLNIPSYAAEPYSRVLAPSVRLRGAIDSGDALAISSLAFPEHVSIRQWQEQQHGYGSPPGRRSSSHFQESPRFRRDVDSPLSPERQAEVDDLLHQIGRVVGHSRPPVSSPVLSPPVRLVPQEQRQQRPMRTHGIGMQQPAPQAAGTTPLMLPRSPVTRPRIAVLPNSPDFLWSSPIANTRFPSFIEPSPDPQRRGRQQQQQHQEENEEEARRKREEQQRSLKHAIQLMSQSSAYFQEEEDAEEKRISSHPPSFSPSSSSSSSRVITTPVMMAVSNTGRLREVVVDAPSMHDSLDERRLQTPSAPTMDKDPSALVSDITAATSRVQDKNEPEQDGFVSSSSSVDHQRAFEEAKAKDEMEIAAIVQESTSTEEPGQESLRDRDLARMILSPTRRSPAVEEEKSSHVHASLAEAHGVVPTSQDMIEMLSMADKVNRE